MTIAETTLPLRYAGDGATTAFSITFKFWETSEIKVVLRNDSTGAETDWTEGTQYSITGGDGSTGTLNVDTSPTDYTPADGETLYITSDYANKQSTDIPGGGNLNTADVEQGMDQIVRQIQQLEEKIGRAILFPQTDDPDLTNVLDNSVDRAGAYVNFDSNGNASTTSTVPVPGFGNLLRNGDFRIAQRGTSFTSGSTPANNDDAYLLDGWILLSDGNDIVDVSQKTDATIGDYASIQLDVETVQKKFGILQIIEQKDLAGLLDGNGVVSLSFKAKVSDAAKLDNIKAAILSWSSTADSVTSDVVSSWNAADTTPTFATNWTAENTPANLSVTATEATFKVENIAIDTASVANIAVFIWSDAVADNDTLGTLLHITDVKLEKGRASSAFYHAPIQEELARNQRYFVRTGSGNFATAHATTAIASAAQWPVEMRAAPTVSLNDTTPTIYQQGVGTKTGSGSSLTINSAATAQGVGEFSLDGFTGLTANTGIAVGFVGNPLDATAEL